MEMGQNHLLNIKKTEANKIVKIDSSTRRKSRHRF